MVQHAVLLCELMEGRTVPVQYTDPSIASVPGMQNLGAQRYLDYIYYCVRKKECSGSVAARNARGLLSAPSWRDVLPLTLSATLCSVLTCSGC